MSLRHRALAAFAAALLLPIAGAARADAQFVATTSPSGPTPCWTGLAYGNAPLSGSITSAGERDCLRFSGSAGDRVRARVVATSGSLAPHLDIGAAECTTGPAAELTCTLGADGGHALTIRDASGSGTGGYMVSIQRLDDPVGCSALTFDPATRTGAVTQGETECWRIAAAAGDQLRLRVVTAATALAPRVELVRPDGTTECGPAATVEQTCTADTAGVHTVLVRDAAAGTGGYSLSAQRLADPVGCAPKAFGTDAAYGVVTTTGEMDCWRFDGSSGQSVRIRVTRTSGTINPTVEVLRPRGTTRCATTTADDVTCRLDASGTHTILVRDAARGTARGDYRLGLQRLNDPVGCGWLSYGTGVATGSIAATAETDCFRFAAAGASRVRVRVVATSGAWAPVAELVDAAGVPYCGPAHAGDKTCRLRGVSTQTQTLLIRDSLGTRTGGYRVSLQRLDAPVGCAEDPGAAGAGGWVSVAALGCWIVEARDGHRLRIRTIETSGGLDPVTEVLRPDGTTVCQPGTRDDTTCVLDTDGPHTVLVRSAATAGSGGYRLATIVLNDHHAACPDLATSPSAHTAWLSAPAEIDCYRTWASSAGPRSLRVEATSGTFRPVVEVLRPDGTLRCRVTAPDGWFDCYGDQYEYQRILVYDAGGHGSGSYEIDRR